MNISFDLDNTLIPYSDEFKTEKRNWLAKYIGIEKIRKGTPNLIHSLQDQGHKVHIYTSSYRKKIKIRMTFKYYGIKIGKVVNEFENRCKLNQLGITSSKYPPAFDFNVHVDDSEGVRIESEKFNFKAIIIETNDTNWDKTIKNKIKNLEQLNI
ncbi:HAD family hydrolase [Flavobacterium sp. J27]|uniref:HAD family hydrolase n=1 Tax=Flavobacterium sp. J27 TaxID=2060419 RepID=UPI001031300E|nr:HAD family hydrolase [Flavobacterium sp. J27]